MSGGASCKCCKKWEDKIKYWAILRYKCNYSAFESPKGAWHPSSYSDLKCIRCGAIWRTKANYVDNLETLIKE